jgi:tmRNA-binding protein
MDDSREKDIIFKLTTYNSLTDTTLGATQAKIHLLNVFSVSSTQLVYNNEVDTMTNWLMPSSEFYRGIVKIEIVLGRGKKLYDKRETIKERDINRELKKELVKEKTKCLLEFFNK